VVVVEQQQLVVVLHLQEELIQLTQQLKELVAQELLQI
jgi:hypothetical protein